MVTLMVCFMKSENSFRDWVNQASGPAGNASGKLVVDVRRVFEPFVNQSNRELTKMAIARYDTPEFKLMFAMG